MLDLTPEQRKIGKENFYNAAGGTKKELFENEGFTRRSLLIGAAAAVPSLGALYFGYEKLQGNPVKVAWIGTGDEGSVLINEHPPEYMDIVAVCDIRPTNQKRAFLGDNNDVRMGLNRKLGKQSASTIKVFSDYKELLKNKDELGLEAVVIAVPLKMHAEIGIDCLNAGLHVLTEKLMAHSVKACKEMIHAARKNDRLIAVGHQRHYSILYEHCNDILRKGLMGTIKHIRASWHRNNSFPGADGWLKKIPAEDATALKGKTKEHGWESLEELVNWRLYYSDDDEVPGSPAIAGGLMAELGSHQLDACSIFLGKVHPLAVYAYGGKNYFGIKGLGPEDKWQDRREIDDHVYVTMEFPGPLYHEDPDDIVIVTYSSLNTNRAEPYGERVWGSRGTMIVEQEQEVLLFKEAGRGEQGGPDQRLWVVDNKDGQPVLQTSESLAPSTQTAVARDALQKVSRGYREEMEHFAHCIRTQGPHYWRDGQMVPPSEGGLRCSGLQGMADVVMALTCNLSMRTKQRIEFKDEWFDPDNDATPKRDLFKNAKLT